MTKKLLGFMLLALYFVVIAVALSEGPLISLQSIILGVIGLIIIIISASELAKTIRLVDIPDGIRKKHKGQIPLIGGLALFISFIYGAIVFGVNPFYNILIISLVPIVIVGTIDGIKGMKVPISIRIISQIIASWILIGFTGIYIKDLGNLFGTGAIYLNEFGIPFTIFGVVGMCNAFNMLDGKDGLTGSVSVIIFSALLLTLFLGGVIYNWGAIMILSLLVFLCFNLSLFGEKRKIFLGDHGSTGLGYIVAWTFIYLSQETDFITPVSALYFVAVPLLDALLTFSRRIRSSKSVFSGDNLHFHHILSKAGLSDILILLIISAASALAASFGIVSLLFNLKEHNLFFGFITIFISLVLLGRAKPKNL